MGKIKGMYMDMADTPEYEEGYTAYGNARVGDGGHNPYPASEPYARRCWAQGWRDACVYASEQKFRDVGGPN